MVKAFYDIITVGGGLAGAAIAKAMAEQGADVLVLESTIAFRDRIRGEGMPPWGVVELRELGLYPQPMQSVGHELPWSSGSGGATCVFHGKLPPNPQESCRLIHAKVATQST